MNENTILEGFERDFLQQNLNAEVERCRKQELAPIIIEVLFNHQPVLEAGCGTGKWIHFLKRHKITCVGLDWSKALQAASRAYDETVQFDVGDLRAMPYTDGQFGGVLALGSIEHVIEGPERILRELFRVLRKGGVGVITVPFFSKVAGFSHRLCSQPLRRLKRHRLIRRLFRKGPVVPGNPVPYRDLKRQRYRDDIYLEVDFQGFFFQYQFRPQQLSEEITRVGFKVQRLFAFAGAFGVYMHFGNAMQLGRLVGRYDRDQEELHLTWLGRVLANAFPTAACGHMLCAVVRK